jgi:hypothetical protein
MSGGGMSGPRRHVIGVYTLDDCVSILFAEEQELKIWLDELLNHQKGRSEDGRVPKPNYEHMWPVIVKEFKPEDPMNTFEISGPHRLVVTTEDIKLFPLGQKSAIALRFDALRSLLTPNNKMFRLSTGRLATSGAGTMDMICNDREAAMSLFKTVRRGTGFRNFSIRLLKRLINAFFMSVDTVHY